MNDPRYKNSQYCTKTCKRIESQSIQLILFFNIFVPLVLWDVEIICIVVFGVVLWAVSCYIRLHRNLNYVTYVIIQVLRSFQDITRLCHVLCEVHLCVTLRLDSLWQFGFYCECYVCNACVELNLNHFVLYLIIYASLCCVCSAQWLSVMLWGAQPPTEIKQGFFSDFPRMQSGMFVILCNTIFNYCNFNRYVYIYIYSRVVRTSKHF